MNIQSYIFIRNILLGVIVYYYEHLYFSIDKKLFSSGEDNTDEKIGIFFDELRRIQSLPCVIKPLSSEYKDKLNGEVLKKIFEELLLEIIFNNAYFMAIANGTFLVLDLNGQLTVGGGIHVGPFFNYTANDDFPAYDGIKFQFFAPPLNPVSTSYIVKEGSNLDKTLIDFEGSEKGLIDLWESLDPQAFKTIKIIPITEHCKISGLMNQILCIGIQIFMKASQKLLRRELSIIMKMQRRRTKN